LYGEPLAKVMLIDTRYGTCTTGDNADGLTYALRPSIPSTPKKRRTAPLDVPEEEEEEDEDVDDEDDDDEVEEPLPLSYTALFVTYTGRGYRPDAVRRYGS